MNGLIRIIPRLDIKGAHVVKGFQFDGLRVLGTSEEFAEIYYREGADELVYQDVVASLYGRPIDLEYVQRVAKRAFVPLTVAGGMRSVADIRAVLRAGADKVGINTAAVGRPELIKEAAQAFGSQCIVASIEVFRQKTGEWEVWTDFGRGRTSADARTWAKQVVELGAGEIMLSSINQEGTGRGYDLELIREISKSVSVPVIACGGAGSVTDLVTAAQKGGASGVCASSIFHYFYARHEALELPAKRYTLRKGAPIDSGNVDFLLHGYGGYRDLQVTPASFGNAKVALSEAGLRTRPHRGGKTRG